ncbi:unnamed protein product [Arctogadus glacialis]
MQWRVGLPSSQSGEVELHSPAAPVPPLPLGSALAQRPPNCLWYIATGDSISSLAFSYHLGEGTVSNAIKGTCDAINLRKIFKRSIYLNPNKVDAIVLTTCILHNVLLQPAEMGGRWLEEQEGNNLEDMERMRGGGGNRGGQAAQVGRQHML